MKAQKKSEPSATATHTPGPWEYNGTAGITALSGAKRLANLGKELEGGTVGLSRSEKDANARLIAAAPDLLAALERLKDYVLADPVAEQALEQARAAIARARGVQS